MAENNKQRNGFLTLCLWLGIFGYLAFGVDAVMDMYGDSVYKAVLAHGLIGILNLVNVLGVILMMRWRRTGFYLLALSAVLLAVIYQSLLKSGLPASLGFLVVVGVWLIVLQLKSGSKSTWSQLKSGWDPEHCRHIYQLFGVLELILFVLTIIACGNVAERHEVVYRQVETSTQEEKPAEATDSVKSSDKVKDQPKEQPKETKKVEESKEQKSDEKPQSKKKSDQDNLMEAANYLDTHDVWDDDEMKKTKNPYLKNLTIQIYETIRNGKILCPLDLERESKVFKKLMSVVVRYIGLVRRTEMPTRDLHISPFRIHPRQLEMELRHECADMMYEISKRRPQHNASATPQEPDEGEAQAPDNPITRDK